MTDNKQSFKSLDHLHSGMPVMQLHAWSEDDVFATTVEIAVLLKQPISEIERLGLYKWFICGLMAKEVKKSLK